MLFFFFVTKQVGVTGILFSLKYLVILGFFLGLLLCVSDALLSMMSIIIEKWRS